MKISVFTAISASLVWAAQARSAPTEYNSTAPDGLRAPDTTGFKDPYVRLSKGGRAVCIHGDVPVQTTTTQYRQLTSFPVPNNQSDATQAILSIVTAPSPVMQQTANNSMPPISDTYMIRGTLCTPLNATTDGIQFLTHGLGFDRHYWDFAPGYSYVDVAAENHKATFLYDRLGVGQSQKPDAVDIVQAAFEVQIANTLAQSLREGKFLSKKFDTIVGVGHSFGSLITQSITGLYPSTFNATVLTGFSINSTGLVPFTTGLNYAIASVNQPYRFADLAPGYLVASNAISTQTGFFHLPGANPAVISKAEDRKATVTYGELLTSSSLTMQALQYTGAVAVVNGNEDLPFCFSNCSAPVDQAAFALKALYPHTKNTSSYLAQKTGHALNLHYSAGATFQWIQDFLVRTGH